MRSQVVFAAKLCCLLILLLQLAGCNSETATESDSVSDAVASGDRVVITEAEIKDAMKKDDEARFLGQQLELKGIVGAFGADGGGSMILDEVLLWTVEREPWAKAMVGQEVVLVGTYTEERGLKFAIESVSGDRIVVEAPELAKEFITDKVATNTKYEDKSLEVHGTVSESKIGAGDIVMIRLKSDGENAVMCNFFPNGQKELVRKVKVGDKIKFVGSYASQTTLADESPILNDCLLITE